MFALSHVVAVRGLDLVTKASHLDRGTSCRVVGGLERYCCHMGSTRPHGTHPLIQGRTKQVAVPHFLSSFPGALGQRDSATNLMLGCQPLTACRPPLPPPPLRSTPPLSTCPQNAMRLAGGQRNVARRRIYVHSRNGAREERVRSLTLDASLAVGTRKVPVPC